MPNFRVKISLSHISDLSDGHRKKLLRTANHTKGVDRSIMAPNGDLICHLNLKNIRMDFDEVEKKLVKRIEDKIRRCHREARRAERQEIQLNRREEFLKQQELATASTA